MELHPTPFPVKSRYMKPKSIRNKSEDPKINTKGAPLREKRVFGTSRNPNIPTKTAPENPAKAKPSSGLLKKAAKPSQSTRSPTDTPAISDAKNSSEKNTARPKKKSVCFQQNEVERNVLEPQTPLKSPAVQAKPRLSSTPYHSVGRCSKCRFDRLETSAYWLGQIKLAESVGKRFVSAAFFQLALECKAEPIRNIRVELKKYMGRHEYLNGEEEWRKLLVSYGLVKEESCESKEGTEEEVAILEDEKDTDLQNEIVEEHET